MVETISVYLAVAIPLWIILMVIALYKLKPHRTKDVKGTFLRAPMLASTNTSGFLLAASAIYLIVLYTFFQLNHVPETLLFVAFFGSGILFIWTLGNFWAGRRPSKGT